MTDKNPFDEVPVEGEAASANPFDNINDVDPTPATSSAGGALARGAVRGTLPAVGGIAAAARGARLGMMAGALIPGLGETGIGEIGGAFAGGLIGGFGGSALVDQAQDYLISKLPDSWKDPIEEQQKADIEKHPYASFAGGLVPFAVTMSPGAWTRAALPANATALQRIMAHPATAHLFGGAVQGGIELGQEAVNGDYDWRKLAISSGFGLVFNTPNRIGRFIEGHSGPTIAQAHDAKVAGEGVTEEVFQGTQQQDPHAEMAAQDAARAEAPIEQQQPDVHAVARRMEPELLAQWDELNKRRDSFRDWVDEAEGSTVEPVARQHLRATEDELGKLAPQVAAAYRRAADHAGAETVEPEQEAPPAAQEQAVTPATTEQATAAEQPPQATPAPAKPIAEQKAFIADDVKRQLIAAGRPADEAKMGGELIAARYATRAALNAKRGATETAEDLYKREGARIVGPGRTFAQPAPAAPAAAETAATEAPAPAQAAQKSAADVYAGLVEGRGEMRPLRSNLGGFNDDRSKLGVPLRPKARQDWQPGNVVNVGFAKDLVIVSKDEGGVFTLLGKPDANGESQSYTVKAHGGLQKGEKVDFLETVKQHEGLFGYAQNQKELFQIKEQQSPEDNLVNDLGLSLARLSQKTKGDTKLAAALHDRALKMMEALGLPADAFGMGRRFGLVTRRLDDAYGQWTGGRTRNIEIATKGNLSAETTLAHEWWHALDNYFGSFDRDDNLFDYRYMSDRVTGEPYITGAERGASVREEVKQAFDDLQAAIFQGENGEPSEYVNRAKKQDQEEGKNYWSQPIEVTARAFEDYLSQKAGLKHSGIGRVPAADREAVFSAFDELFKTLKVRVAESGGRELYQSRDQTETPEFKRWFGASKVVDESGKPLVVYKGMHPYSGGDVKNWKGEVIRTEPIQYHESIDRKSEFPAFNGNEKGVKIAGFFGDSDTASKFAELFNPGAVYPSFLKMEKPFVIDAKGGKAGPIQFGESGKPFRDAIRSGEYDGVIIKNTADEGTIYVALKSEDIKSAIGNRGTFDPNDPRILYQGTAGGSIRFRDNDPRATIRLMATADASTFIHESGHDFLEQLKRDAAHEAAPDQLRKDWETTKSCLGATDGELKTKHHEKFARGFEQYMREGIAPSKELAGIFARFKSWMLNIYQTIKGLGSPINDDIRGVFDRLLAEQPQRTVIAPDIERGKTLAGLHEEEAAETQPSQADATMARVEHEAERHETELHPEVQNGLAPVVAKIEAEAAAEPGAAANTGTENAAGAEEAGHLGASGGGPEPVAGPGARSEGSEPKLGSSGNAGAESGGVSGSEQRSVSAKGAGAGAGTGSGVPFPRPAEQFEPAESKLVDKAGNIRIDNLTTSEDVAKAIREAAEVNDDFIGDRRGVISDGQVMELAEALGMDETQLSKRKLGQAFNAEQVMAARKLLIQSATDVSAAMKKAAEGTDEDVMAYAKAKDRHQMIQAQVAGITAEAGRALRAFHSIVGQESTMAVDQFIKQATGKTLFQMRQEAKLGAQLETPQQVSRFMQDSEKRGFASSLLEYWINGLISGPATHTTYMIGNMLLAFEKSGPETLIAAGIGAARRAMGREGATVRAGEAGAQFRAAVSGLAPALKASAEAFRTGQTTLLPGESGYDSLLPVQHSLGEAARYDTNANYRDAMQASFAIARGIRDGIVSGAALLKAGGVQGEPTWGRRYTPGGAIPDYTFRGVGVAPVGTLIRGPSRFIAAIHSLFRSMNFSMEKGALAYRQAAEEGRTGMDLAQRAGELYTNPTPEMMEASVHEATELTLMGKGGAFTNALSRLTNTNVFGLPLLKFVDPFVKISSNVFEQSLIKRTPMGWLSGELRKDLLGENGTIAQDRAQARMLAGTALCVGFGTLAAQGLVSGSGPKDPKKAAMWRLAGNQAHSVRIGDVWYDMHRLGPLGMLMGMSADLYDVIHKADEGKGEEAAAHLFHAVIQNVLDESFVRGPAELIGAIEDPERKGQAYIQNFLSSFTPYSVGTFQIARAMDPYSRQAHSTIEAIKRHIPGMSESLMPRRDIWGEALPNPDAVIAPGVTALYEKQVSTDPVNLAMVRLGIAPAQVGHHIRNVELSDTERDDFIRTAGRMSKMQLDRIVKSPMFGSWPPHVQRDVITTVIKQSREAARGLMFARYPHILRDAAQNKMKKLQGADIEEIE